MRHKKKRECEYVEESLIVCKFDLKFLRGVKVCQRLTYLKKVVGCVESSNISGRK